MLALVLPCKKVNDLPKVCENYNFDLPKVSEVIVTYNLNLLKVRKMTKVTCPKLVKLASNLLDFYVKLDFYVTLVI